MLLVFFGLTLISDIYIIEINPRLMYVLRAKIIESRSVIQLEVQIGPPDELVEIGACIDKSDDFSLFKEIITKPTSVEYLDSYDLHDACCLKSIMYLNGHKMVNCIFLMDGIGSHVFPNLEFEKEYINAATNRLLYKFFSENFATYHDVAEDLLGRIKEVNK